MSTVCAPADGPKGTSGTTAGAAKRGTTWTTRCTGGGLIAPAIARATSPTGITASRFPSRTEPACETTYTEAVTGIHCSAEARRQVDSSDLPDPARFASSAGGCVASTDSRSLDTSGSGASDTPIPANRRNSRSSRTRHLLLASTACWSGGSS